MNIECMSVYSFLLDKLFYEFFICVTPSSSSQCENGFEFSFSNLLEDMRFVHMYGFFLLQTANLFSIFLTYWTVLYLHFHGFFFSSEQNLLFYINYLSTVHAMFIFTWYHFLFTATCNGIFGPNQFTKCLVDMQQNIQCKISAANFRYVYNQQLVVI